MLRTELEPLDEQYRDALRAAYIAGATDVHIYWRGLTGTERPEPDFAEAASDYATERGTETAAAIESLLLRVEGLEAALRDIREATEKRQLPLTDQIYRRADQAIEQSQ